MTASYHFIVVDDHPLYREAVVQVLEDTFSNLSIAQCDTLSSFETLASDMITPDLILLDLNMPDAQGLSGLQRVRALVPDIPVAIISAEENRQVILQALTLGAVGFISKALPRLKMGHAVEKILEGEVVLPNDLMRVANTEEVSFSNETLSNLTNKQLLVLEQLAAGFANKQIASQLNLSESTVKTHVSDILRRLGVSNRVQAANQVRGINFNYYLNR